MKTLDGQTIFTYMTNLSDKFIEEAAYPLPTSHEPTSVKPSWWQKVGHLVNSPVGVALICGVVSLGILAGIVMAGRNAPPTPPVGGTVSADTEADTEVESTTEYHPAPISSEAEALEAAKAYILSKNMKLPTDLENLRCYASYYQASQIYWVFFRYDLADIETDYRLNFDITPDGVITNVHESSWDENSYFMVYTENDVRVAKDRITDTNDGSFYFDEKDGKLFVCKEVIVPLTPPPAVTDEEGNGYVYGGCGFDHDHVFYREEVRHKDK